MYSTPITPALDPGCYTDDELQRLMSYHWDGTGDMSQSQGRLNWHMRCYDACAAEWERRVNPPVVDPPLSLTDLRYATLDRVVDAQIERYHEALAGMRDEDCDALDVRIAHLDMLHEAICVAQLIQMREIWPDYVEPF